MFEDATYTLLAYPSAVNDLQTSVICLPLYLDRLMFEPEVIEYFNEPSLLSYEFTQLLFDLV
jgi:hypothetical protein